ncbi:anaerobic ribonucleoside-triphosphate reductase activating protein [Candidatus Peregrinibacteria bacterium HGW-Peregrinibacteria-1]|jgi:pyruvate formate lyase activating enzyme|nr:MAG: anaerobic ribonucleoside-triphosphate reductase activating protein [Candidatus Peregrinibacteria bacterium HGW-Peregrinibacteria-1]
MLITALTKLTLLDFPDRLACIIFTGGCNLRCGYCHNAEFVLPEKLRALSNTIPFETIKNFLYARQGKLDGVVICGGEPTIQPDLLEKIAEIKEMGFQVKVDTNGSRPTVIKKLIQSQLVDFWAMDIKDSLPYRKELLGVPVEETAIRESIQLIKDSGAEYEFRTTIFPNYHDLKTLQQIGHELSGAKKWALQKGRSGKTLIQNFNNNNEYSESDLKTLQQNLLPYATKVIYRT